MATVAATKVIKTSGCLAERPAKSRWRLVGVVGAMLMVVVVAIVVDGGGDGSDGCGGGTDDGHGCGGGGDDAGGDHFVSGGGVESSGDVGCGGDDDTEVVLSLVVRSG